MTTLTLPLLHLPNHHHHINLNFTIKNRDHPITSLIDQCSDASQVKQIHAHMLRIGLIHDAYSVSRLLTITALSPFSPSLDYARRVFDQIPEPNIYMWNTLIRGYASSADPSQSLRVFLDMLYECSDAPNKFTYPFVIKAASELSRAVGLRERQEGVVFHGMVMKTSSLGSNVFILNSLIHFYASCGDLDEAYKVFLRIPKRDVISWNTIITAYAHGDCPGETLELFKGMQSENMRPNDVTMVSVVSACAKILNLDLGRWVHSYIEKNSIQESLILSNAMLDMYVKCGGLEEAKRIFGNMPEKDSFSWTTMLAGYAKSGDFDEAQRVFNAMPKQDVEAWNCLISAYEQNGRPNEALTLFNELQLNKNARPDQITLVSTLSACAQLGAMDLGGWIHVYIKKQGLKQNCHITTSLIDMYSKCGDLEKALEVFWSAEQKDVYVWSAMIAGLGMHGCGRDAINLFLRMQEFKVKPNAVTFTNLLTACSHSKLVYEGKYYFNRMVPVYGVSPQVKHYACMVDILGRAGLIDEAVTLIEKMPIVPGASVWGALLGSCRTHGNVDLAQHAFSSLIKLEPGNHGAYVILSNMHAKLGNWDEVSRLRKVMRDSRIKKEPGCSSIEINGLVHEFLVGDNSHPLNGRIYSKLEEIMLRLKSIGYMPNKSVLLQDVEEEDMKEHALYLHSEKLAIAYALISTSPQAPLRIVKNLRVCGDCHLVAKLVSRVYDREIVLRDRYRFHNFKDGSCSCMDFW